jgi:hypothetical protein
LLIDEIEVVYQVGLGIHIDDFDDEDELDCYLDDEVDIQVDDVIDIGLIVEKLDDEVLIILDLVKLIDD